MPVPRLTPIEIARVLKRLERGGVVTPRYGHSDHEPLGADACAHLGRSRTSSPNFGAELFAVCFDSSALVKLLAESGS